MFDYFVCDHACVEGNALICRCYSLYLSLKLFWIDNLERLRSLEHWFVSCWCGCSQILFVSEHSLFIMHVVRVLNLTVSNLNVGFLLVSACFCSVHITGS